MTHPTFKVLHDTGRRDLHINVYPTRVCAGRLPTCSWVKRATWKASVGWRRVEL